MTEIQKLILDYGGEPKHGRLTRFAKLTDIPYRTVQNWWQGSRRPGPLTLKGIRLTILEK